MAGDVKAPAIRFLGELEERGVRALRVTAPQRPLRGLGSAGGAPVSVAGSVIIGCARGGRCASQ